jgi:hypothetical protein
MVRILLAENIHAPRHFFSFLRLGSVINWKIFCHADHDNMMVVHVRNFFYCCFDNLRAFNLIKASFTIIAPFSCLISAMDKMLRNNR